MGQGIHFHSRDCDIAGWSKGQPRPVLEIIIIIIFFIFVIKVEMFKTQIPKQN